MQIVIDGPRSCQNLDWRCVQIELKPHEKATVWADFEVWKVVLLV